MTTTVALVRAPVTFEAAYPLGLASLATALKAAGATPLGIDLGLDPRGLERLHAAPPALAVVDTSIRNVQTARRVIAALRRLGIPRVVAAGTAAAVAPARFLGADLADAAVTGDAEAVVPALLAAAPGTAVAGACVRGAFGAVLERPGGVLAAAALPAADREVFPLAAYAEHGLRGARRYAAVEASRGCPFACTFCPVPRRPGGHRVRPVDAVVDELAAAAAAGATGFFFEDEQPLADRGWLADLLAALRRRLPAVVLELPNGVRADLLDAELLGELRAAGVTRLALGIERGTEAGRAALRRPVADAHLARVIAAARGLGLVVTGYFMIGLPGETATELAATLRAAARLPLHYAHVSVYWPWDPPVTTPSRRQRLLALPRLASYLATYATPTRLRDLVRAGDLSLATLPRAVPRLGRWLGAGSAGGGGW